jgi:hypothetical protein
VAWSTPSARTTGELITAAIWNQDVKDNPIALRGGAIAIASQAALDFIYASSSTQFARLVKGNAYQVPRMNSAANAWEFASFNINQVINATYGTQASSSSSAYADTGLTASITPTSSSNKVLVLVHQAGCGKDTGNTSINLKLLRGATLVAQMASQDAFTGDTSANFIGGISGAYLDSPATTSSTTYKTQYASAANIASAYVQNNSGVSSIALLEVTQ